MPSFVFEESPKLNSLYLSPCLPASPGTWIGSAAAEYPNISSAVFAVRCNLQMVLYYVVPMQMQFCFNYLVGNERKGNKCSGKCVLTEVLKSTLPTGASGDGRLRSIKRQSKVFLHWHFLFDSSTGHTFIPCSTWRRLTANAFTGTIGHILAASSLSSSQ